MANPYGPILSQLTSTDGSKFIEGGKLGKGARARYVDEVLGLLATGNANGKGGLDKGLFGIAPLPPIAGPSIFNVTTLKAENLFWFEPDPLATLMATLLVDEDKTPIWNAIFPDLIYGKTAVALDANGSTPLFPLFDVSVAFPDIKGFPIALPDLAIKANITPLPKLQLKLADLGIKLSVPSIPIPPLPPSLPSFDPKLPDLALKAVTALPDLILGLIKLPFDLLLKLVLPPNMGLILDLIQFKFDAIFKLAFDIVVDLLAPLIQIVPKLLIASILIYLKDVVAMVAVDIVGMVTGAGGSLTNAVATFGGLIS